MKVLPLILILSLAGCSTLINGRKHELHLVDVPPDSTVYIDGDEKSGSGGHEYVFHKKNYKSTFQIKVTNDKYKDYLTTVGQSYSLWVIVGGIWLPINPLWGGGSLIVDFWTGGAFILDEDVIYVEMEKKAPIPLSQ